MVFYKLRKALNCIGGGIVLLIASCTQYQFFPFFPYESEEPVKCSIYFELNGGSGQEVLTVNKGTTVELSQYVPTRSGYDFIGYYTDSSLEGNYLNEITVTHDTTLYARWLKPAVPTEEQLANLQSYIDSLSDDEGYSLHIPANKSINDKLSFGTTTKVKAIIGETSPVSIDSSGRAKSKINERSEAGFSEFNASITVTGSDLVIKNIVIDIAEGSNSSAHGLILDENASVQLENSVISNASKSSSCGIRLVGKGASVTVKTSDISSWYYGIGIRDYENSITVEDSTLSGWAGIMTSAGDFSSNEIEANTDITVKNSELISNPVSNGDYGAIVLQEKYNHVNLTVQDSTLRYGTYRGTNQGLSDSAEKITSALHVRSYGNNVNISNCILNTEKVENAYADGVIVLGYDGYWVNAALWESASSNTISINDSYLYGKEGDKLITNVCPLGHEDYFNVVIDGELYSVSNGRQERIYVKPTIRNSSGDETKSSSEEDISLVDGDTLILDNRQWKEGTSTRSELTIDSVTISSGKVALEGYGEKIKITTINGSGTYDKTDNITIGNGGN